jgi:thiol-disulfide isomerase/thioredoxin
MTQVDSLYFRYAPVIGNAGAEKLKSTARKAGFICLTMTIWSICSPPSGTAEEIQQLKLVSPDSTFYPGGPFDYAPMKVGILRVDTENYLLAIRALDRSKRDTVGYSIQSLIWVDRDRDSLVSANDHFGLARHPFSVGNRSYELMEVDSGGESVSLRLAIEIEPIVVGSVVPDFPISLLDSTRTSLTRLTEKYLLVDFWGTWCGPCLQELPYLRKAYKKHRGAGLQILGLSYDYPIDLELFLQKNEIPWPNSLRSKDNIEDTPKRVFQVRSLPSTFLLDRDRRIVATGKDLKGPNLEETLTRILNH